MNRLWLSRIVFSLLLLVLAGGGFAASRIAGPLTGPPGTAPVDGPPRRTEAGPQLVMIYVAHSECGWSNHPSLPAAVDAIRAQLAEHAREHQMSFKSVGVALDWSTGAGLDYLSGFGDFDEVSVGSSWANSWVVRYNAMTPDLAVPSIYLVHRVLTSRDGNPESLVFEEIDAELLAVRTGAEPIVAWAKSRRAVP